MRERIIKHSRRLAIGIIGIILFLAGIIMVPYPGPGWLVVFAGLAVLATEFEFAQKILDYLQDKYRRWQNWLAHQKLPIRLLVISFTGLVVVVTAWLLNSFGVINRILSLDIDWLNSPLFK